MLRWQIVVVLLVNAAADPERAKRQLSIDDLISRALSLVRPIFDTSQPLQNDEMLKKQPVPSTDDIRDSSILGARAAHPLDDIPLCKGSNRICQFISCSAENFKKDPTFGNIQLAAQVLSDKKLRQAISREQGMDEGQCKLFSNGFQLIDRFITTIESRSPAKSEDPPRTEVTRQPDHKENDIMMDDAEYVMDLPQPREKVYGSKTWSSQPEQEHPGPHLLEIRNDLVASFTPLPPAPFVHPTPPPAPPLAFPTVPSLIVPPLLPPILPVDKLFHLKIDPIIRRQRDIDWDFMDEEDNSERRVKRDYYDEVHTSKSGSSSSSSSSSSSLHSTGSTVDSSDDYYGTIAESTPKKHEESSPLQNCVHILGIY
ncbi:hypothetical protein RB195_021265 [Necator americanus]|uniref:Uncharacterized protein n=1 Tax=Necator americanus TaxID=51031 RepID=A0ABR1EA69_NECAM